jgi:hypothetical protein
MELLTTELRSIVMPGLGPGIHEFLGSGKLVDAKAKPWHDD